MLMIVTGVKIDVVVHTLIHVEPALQTQRNVSSIVVRGGGYSVGGSRSSSAVGARGAPRQVFTSGVRVSRASGTAITIVVAENRILNATFSFSVLEGWSKRLEKKVDYVEK